MGRSSFSGIKVIKDGPVLSFGRVNYFESKSPLIKMTVYVIIMSKQ
ncbi:hypothetical protein [Candidatus Mesenet endosymbiont of Phosphuga atrata]